MNQKLTCDKLSFSMFVTSWYRNNAPNEINYLVGTFFTESKDEELEIQLRSRC